MVSIISFEKKIRKNVIYLQISAYLLKMNIPIRYIHNPRLFHFSILFVSELDLCHLTAIMIQTYEGDKYTKNRQEKRQI